MNTEKADTYHFSLYTRHIELLDNVNENNRSGALQMVLDSIITGEDQMERRKQLDQSIHYATYGAILLFISYLMPFEARIFAVVGGVSLFAYGIIGGVRVALSRARYNR